MKRTVPLLITFLTGVILIVASFIPYTQNWKNDVLVWFDILASIAFVLGGGNLLMMHLKKVSDRKAGWGFSLVTLVAFLATLVLGSIKFGSIPEPQSERYGETAARLRLADFPQEFTVSGRLPDEELPPIVKGQISQSADGEKVVFRGWLTPSQQAGLKSMEYEDDWHATVDELFKIAQPPDELKERIEYQAQLERLFLSGVMLEQDRTSLAAVRGNAAWEGAVDSLDTLSNRQHAVPLGKLPDGYEIPEPMGKVLVFDASTKELRMTGPMSVAQRSLLIYHFPKGPSLTDEDREQLRRQLEQLGPFPPELVDALAEFKKEASTVARRNHDLLFELLRVAKLHPGVDLTEAQRAFLLKDYDKEIEWEIKVGDLFAESHQEKYPYSGKYNSEGSAIWYIYEYAFQPLTATMFALLAFYVASAAFRAFRAKNVEAMLLLGTAFIVLLGRTYLGTWLTSWVPDRFSGLTIPELTVVIMQVFTTAGNRAIMIGIALGVVSTSLKILLGIDRSYLGSDRE